MESLLEIYATSVLLVFVLDALLVALNREGGLGLVVGCWQRDWTVGDVGLVFDSFFV